MTGPTGQPPQGYPPPPPQQGYPPPPPPPGYYFNPQPQPSRAKPTAIIAIFVGVMLGLALVVGILVMFSQPKPPEPPCATGEHCAPQPSLPPVSPASPSTPPVGPTAPPITSPTPGTTLAPGQTATPIPLPSTTPASNAAPLISETEFRNEALGYSFEYDSGLWTMTEQGDTYAVFVSVPFDAQLIIQVTDASTTPRQIMDAELAFVDGFMIGRVEDPDSYDALLGPSIGYIRGEGTVYAGTMTSQDGTPVGPGGVTILGATDGRLSAGVIVIVWSPDEQLGGETHQHAARSTADLLIKTFDWNLND